MGVTDQARGQTSKLIAIVDDDESMQDSPRDLVESTGLVARRFGSVRPPLKTVSSVKVSRCHRHYGVEAAIVNFRREQQIHSVIARANQRFAMVSAPVAIGNAVARTSVIKRFAKSGGAICKRRLNRS